MKNYRINNFRMAGYAALAAGIINFRYQWGSDGNLGKSLVLVAPGALLILLSFTSLGKKWMQSKSSTVIVVTIGLLLLGYSFLI